MNQPRSCGGRFARVYSDDLRMATCTPYFSARLSARVKQDELDVRRDARDLWRIEAMEARCANVSNEVVDG